MFDFEVKVKVSYLYEITYEEVVTENDRNGLCERTITKTERFTDWDKLRSFAYNLKTKKIVQVVEVKDMTNALQNEMRTQGKD